MSRFVIGSDQGEIAETLILEPMVNNCSSTSLIVKNWSRLHDRESFAHFTLSPTQRRALLNHLLEVEAGERVESKVSGGMEERFTLFEDVAGRIGKAFGPTVRLGDVSNNVTARGCLSDGHILCLAAALSEKRRREADHG